MIKGKTGRDFKMGNVLERANKIVKRDENYRIWVWKIEKVEKLKEKKATTAGKLEM